MRDGDLGTGIGQHPGCGGADAADSADDERYSAFKGNRVTHGEVLFFKQGLEKQPKGRRYESVGEDAGCLDDGFPALDFSLQVAVEDGGCRLFKRYWFGAQIGETLDHHRVL